MPLKNLTLGPQARWFVAALIVVAMLALFYRRVRGDNTDASLRKSYESSTGSASFLLSGTMVFMALAVGAALFLAPEIMQTPLIGAVLLVPVLIAWILNKREVAM